ncbi:ATP-dependent DNA helicase Q-like SIM [Vitis vinifera]|uniref:DNA 3'-5' helicase n=1 Tax=Vitis vinifera TaxID=29760 RepID=A0A438D843_VITVI|nr:ATP-dependent DNA helicase Q-like SIM [Vitis vinifera]
MDGNNVHSDQVIAELIEMGFEFSAVTEAIAVVGPSLDDAIEFILNGPHRSSRGASSNSKCPTSTGKALDKTALISSHSLDQMRQSSITEHLQPVGRSKRIRTNSVYNAVSPYGSEMLPGHLEEQVLSFSGEGCNLKAASELSALPVCCQQELEIGKDWVQRVNSLLHKHFGILSLKSFRRKPCLLGKSLCFQVPALLTGKVVVVISPLISLMHDQCLKLAKHGVSACFLGSGQPDSSVEQKAMSGMYEIIYVCPETVLRLIKPLRLQKIAELHYLQLMKFIVFLSGAMIFDPTTEQGCEKKQKIFSQELDDASDDSTSSADRSLSEADRMSPSDVENNGDGYFGENDDEANSSQENGSAASKQRQMSVEYLENEVDLFQSVDDWMFPVGPLEQGPTIIYVPTRKETLNIAKYLCRCGVKAAAYNAKLPKSHLRRVHKEFHDNALQVVVATIAFGMGIDKLNVRRIIHYGWPQSLEAYYQEAGRSGRDGKLADCILYANLSRVPTLLPSQRSEDQTKQAYKMLSDCFRYGMNTTCCRAKTLVEYFGEDFCHQSCILYGKSSFVDDLYDDVIYGDVEQQRFMDKLNLRMLVSRIREQFQKFAAIDLLWWRGLARIMEDKGYIREGDDRIHVQIKFPKPTKLGLEFLQSTTEQTFDVIPKQICCSQRETPNLIPLSQNGEKAG